MKIEINRHEFKKYSTVNRKLSDLPHYIPTLKVLRYNAVNYDEIKLEDALHVILGTALTQDEIPILATEITKEIARLTPLHSNSENDLDSLRKYLSSMNDASQIGINNECRRFNMGCNFDNESVSTTIYNKKNIIKRILWCYMNIISEHKPWKTFMSELIQLACFYTDSSSELYHTVDYCLYKFEPTN